MYGAKRSGEEYAFYDAGADRNTVRGLALVGELRGAIEADRLELHYQPKVSLRSGTCDSVEALLRWTHPVYGFVSPGELIPLIESTEMLRPLTEWTLRRALRQQIDWAHQGLRVRVAVNLSARLLQDASFPERLAQMLAQYGTSPEALELEITESAMLRDGSRALAVGESLRELGVQLSVDDYGTGHSSLAYLRDLSVSTLKLDRTFVDDLENSRGNRFIVESTLALAHALHIDVVAEGIETRAQAEYLRNLGYDYGQGYYFSKALQADACRDWILERNARPMDEAARVA
jgi:EAL domain-containing protein (putative c-di-GMP-specific phosphodiesterase class I)